MVSSDKPLGPPAIVGGNLPGLTVFTEVTNA